MGYAGRRRLRECAGGSFSGNRFVSRVLAELGRQPRQPPGSPPLHGPRLARSNGGTTYLRARHLAHCGGHYRSRKKARVPADTTEPPANRRWRPTFRGLSQRLRGVGIFPWKARRAILRPRARRTARDGERKAWGSGPRRRVRGAAAVAVCCSGEGLPPRKGPTVAAAPPGGGAAARAGPPSGDVHPIGLCRERRPALTSQSYCGRQPQGEYQWFVSGSR